MRRWFYVPVLLVVASVQARAESIGLMNGSFETGDFSGWTVTIPMGTIANNPPDEPIGTARIFEGFTARLPYTDADGNTITEDILPIDGSTFAAIGTAKDRFLTNEGHELSASQTIHLDAGGTISGWSRFFNSDEFSADSAWVRIYDSSGNIIATPWIEFSGNGHPGTLNSTPLFTYTPWVEWLFTAQTAGDYVLALGATASLTTFHASVGYHDAIQVTTPEPNTIALLLLLGSSLALRGRLRARAPHQ